MAMVEETRKKGASIFVYLIFGGLIAAFVLNFGPQSSNGSGCGGKSNQVALEVGDREINRSAWVATFQFMGEGSSEQRTEAALDALIRREVLAAEAEARGLRVSDSMIDEQLKQGALHFGGQRVDGRGAFFEPISREPNAPRFFNLKYLRNFAGQLGVSLGAFKTLQQRELQASLMGDLLRASVQVSRAEALADFRYYNSTVTAHAVRFETTPYLEAMQLTDEDVRRFVAGHSAEIEAKFKADERSYKGVKPQLKLRQVFIAAAVKPTAVTAPAPAADAPAPAAGDAPAPVVAEAPTAPDPGLAVAEALRTDIIAKRKTFAAAAASVASTETARALAGDLGWRTADAPRLGAQALNDAIKTLAVGDVSPVLSTPEGFYLLTVEDKREGDLTLAQVQAEIGRDLARSTWAKEAALRAAQAALTAAQQDLATATPATPAPTPVDPAAAPVAPVATGLAKLYEMPAGQPGIDPYMYLSFPLQPDQRRAIADLILKAAPAPAATTPDVVPTASADALPRFAEVAKPTGTTIGPLPRSATGELGTIGTSPTLTTELFATLTPGQLSARVWELDGAYVIVQLIERKAAVDAEFEPIAEQRIAQLRELRADALVEAFVQERCKAMAAKGEIKPNPELLRFSDADGKPVQSAWQPCRE